MSAMLQPAPSVAAMTVADLDAVTAIETHVYPFPWSRGNFVDSLAAGYLAEVQRDARGEVIAYQVAMYGVDEMHLLNLTVAGSRWGQGHARHLLDRLVKHARGVRASRLWLEVRESNGRARAIYERYGFAQVGLRRGYYPAPYGAREDAIVMSFEVPDRPGAADGLD